MKKIFTVVCMGFCVSGIASNGIGRLNTIDTKHTKELIKEVDVLIRGLCTGSVVVIGGDGNQKTIEMKSVDTDTAKDCSDKFLAFAKEQAASYEVVSTSSNYNEYGPK